MAQSYADAELIPAILAQLKTIQATAGDNTDVAKVERWDAYRRDTAHALHITLRTVGESYGFEHDSWLVNRSMQIAAVIQPDENIAKSTDEALSDVAFDIITALGQIDADATNDAYKCSMGPPSVRWFQNDAPDIVEVGVSIDVTFSWYQDKTDGSITGPAA